MMTTIAWAKLAVLAGSVLLAAPTLHFSIVCAIALRWERVDGESSAGAELADLMRTQILDSFNHNMGRYYLIGLIVGAFLFVGGSGIDFLCSVRYISQCE